MADEEAFFVVVGVDEPAGDAVGAGNLFVIFGEPDITLLPERDGKLRVKVNGVDVFKPQTGEIISDIAGMHTPERLIEAAFRFLLDREPKESILRRFDVSVIARYFPEFERELPRYLAK
jgi:hypothetical protein